jgi:hypothetical protein
MSLCQRIIVPECLVFALGYKLLFGYIYRPNGLSIKFIVSSNQYLLLFSFFLKESAPTIVVLLSIQVGYIIGAFIAFINFIVQFGQHMEEHTVRAWLKEQQDGAETLAQQQAVAFQLQFDALHAELQAMRGLLQSRPCGKLEGGGGLNSFTSFLKLL